MRKLTLFLCAVFLTMIGYSQGSETFQNISEDEGNSSSYLDRTWTGDNGEEWSATDARIDETINDEAITVRNGELSTIIMDGIGDLTLTTQRKHGGGEGDITVSVNDDVVGTIPYDDTEQTNTISGIDVAGEIALLLETPGNGDRVAMDDLTWTAAEDNGGDDCDAIAAPWTEGFEDGESGDVLTSDFNCWGINYETGEVDWKFYEEGHISSDFVAHSGDLMAGFQTSNTGSSTILVSPSIDVSALNSPYLTFYYALKSWVGDVDELKIYYKESASDELWTAIPDAEYTVAQEEWKKIEFNLPDAEGKTDYQIAFAATSNYAKGVYLDDISVNEAPTCFQPSALSVANVSADSAEVSWTAEDSEAEWEVLYGEVGFETDSEGTSEEVDSSNITLDNLTSDTSYEVYVRAICAEDDVSLWEGPVSFITSCEATDVPFTQDFEEVTTPDLPNCGTLETISGNDWKVQNVLDYGFDSNVLNYAYSGTEAADTWYFTQGINLEAGVNYQISYKYGNRGSYAEKLKIAFGTFAESSSMDTELVDHTDILDVNTNEIGFTVPTDGVYYFGFNAHSEQNQNQLYVDDISIVELTDCADAAAGTPEETDLTICPDTSFTIAVNGASTEDAGAGGLTGQWEVSTDDGDSWVAIDGATDPSYSIEDGITEESQYHYVVSCDIDDSTDTSEVISISLNLNPEECYCIPTTTGESAYLDGFTATGDSGQDIENTDTGASLDGNGYSDYTDLPALVANAASDIEFTAEIGGSTAGVRIWVDWSQDGIFDDQDSGEVVYSSSSYQGTQSGSFTVPDDASGTYRLRVGASYIPGDGPADPCELSSSGEYEDYTIEITDDDGDDCAIPTDIVVAEIDDSSVSVSWTPGEDETQWEVLYDVAGFEPDTDGETILVDDTPEATLDGLEEDTAYDVYVRAVCDDDDMSEWAGPVNFTLESSTCIPSTDPDNSAPVRAQPDRNTNFTTTGAVENFVDETTWDYGPGAGTTVDNAAPNGYADLYDTYTVKQSSGESFDFSVDYKGGGAHYYIWIDFNQDNQFEDAEYSEASPDGERFFMETAMYQDPTITGTIAIPEDIEAGEYRMRIRGTAFSDLSDLPCDEIAWGEARDYKLEVLEGEPVLCEAPESIEVNNITETTADVSWTPGGDETQWEVLYDVAGFEPDADGETMLVDDTPEATLDGLEEDTAYDVYVRAVCGEEEFSDWTGPESFNTEADSSTYCDIDADGVTIEEITAVGFGDTNIENDNTDDVLIDKTDTVVDVMLGQTYTLEVEGFTNGDFENDVVAFIDWNQNFILDDDGEVYEVGTLENSTGEDGNSVSLEITIPEDAVLGTTRIRITKTYTDEEGDDPMPPSPAIINPCAIEFDAFEMGAQAGYGQALDFTLNIEEGVAEECEAPTDLEVMDITETTAEVTWNAGGDETMWTVIYGLSGFTQEDENDYETELVFETNYSITDLEPETDYDVYVVAVCDAENMIVSDQTGPFTFTTDDMSVEDHNFDNFTFYPNPVQDQLTLKAGEQIESVVVHNLLGQKVINVKPNTLQTQVELGNLQSGVYLMNVTVNGTQKSFRIVKK